MNIMLVDGYNIIGAWPEMRILKEIDFEKARDLLIEKMAEYQAYTGYRVIVVFDAHSVTGRENRTNRYRVEIIYTKENETADECIEKLAIELNRINNQIHVATSDYTEQWAIFGQGALRKSARDLLAEMKNVEAKITESLLKTSERKRTSKITISEEMREVFEKWRRGKR
jgi:predicted RNA-binding protein with PIN domain